MLKDHETKAMGWKSDISPHAMQIYSDYRRIALECKVEFNGERGYKVADGGDSHTMSIELKRCTCRAWDLYGIPCPHAIKVLMHKTINPLLKFIGGILRRLTCWFINTSFNLLWGRGSRKWSHNMPWHHHLYLRWLVGQR